MLQKLVDAAPANATLSENRGEGYDLTAQVLEAKGDFPAALKYEQRAHDLYSKLFAADHGNTMAEANLGWSSVGIGQILLLQHNPSEAIRRAREAIAAFRASNAQSGFWYAVELSSAYLVLGKAYAALAEQTTPQESAHLWREALSWDKEALSARSTIQSRLDSNGLDQVSDIEHEVARANAALLQVPAVAAKGGPKSSQ
jgi:tetratricopeptide (TPR) repeat protein